MPVEFIHFIAKYGYPSIFILVFIQEIGIPTFPNELALLYFGFICHSKVLNLFTVLSIVICGDISGTFLVYILFYFFSSFLRKHEPGWLKIPSAAKKLIRNRIKRGGNLSILIGRLTPYLRGYTSVMCGIMHVNMKAYVSMIIISAFLWTGGYVLIGYFGAPYIKYLLPKLGIFKNALILIPLIIIIWFLIRFLLKKRLTKSA